MHEHKDRIDKQSSWDVNNIGTSVNPTGIEIDEIDNLEEKITGIISEIKEKNNERIETKE